MKHSTYNEDMFVEDRFGLKLAARLSESADTLSHDISERLRVARMQALGKHKPRQAVMATATAAAHAGSATLTLGDGDSGLWRRAVSLLPLMALVAGLVAIHVFVGDDRAKELAEIDTALLTDDLPPAAYADPGFVQFLKAHHDLPQ